MTRLSASEVGLGTRQENRAQLILILNEPVDESRLSDFLLRESSLPGPRANLELAGDLAQELSNRNNVSDYLPRFTRWLSGDLPDHPAAEYLPFCALNGLGGLYLNAPVADRGAIVSHLRAAANSTSWRFREAVTLALQFIGARDPEAMMQILRDWLCCASLLEMRAAIGTLADPPILTAYPMVANEGLSITGQIFNQIRSLTPNERKSDEFGVLAKAMGFAPSVIVAAWPTRGFGMMRHWASVGDPDINKMLKQNLKKDRLAKRDPAEVKGVESVIRRSQG
jgi:hypothetical protein